MNIGESIRSDVSSRRRRRGGDAVEGGVGKAGGDGVDVGSCGLGDCGKFGGVEMPDS